MPQEQSRNRAERTEQRRREKEERELAREMAARKGKGKVGESSADPEPEPEPVDLDESEEDFPQLSPKANVQRTPKARVPRTPAVPEAEKFSYQECNEALMDTPFVPTKYCDSALLEKMEIYDDVRKMFKNMGLGHLPFCAHPWYKELTCEFLASLTVHLNPDNKCEVYDLGHIKYTVNGEPHEMSMHQLCFVFGLNAGHESSLDRSQFTNLEQVWGSISAAHYKAGVSKASTIKHPAIRYVHKFLAHTIFSRAEANTVKEIELMLLTCGIKPLLKFTTGNQEIAGDGSNVNMAAFLSLRLSKLKEEAMVAGRNKLSQVAVGGIITYLLMYTPNVSLPKEVTTKPQLIDEIALSTSWILGGMVGEKYVYKFHPRTCQCMGSYLFQLAQSCTQRLMNPFRPPFGS